MDKHDIGWAVAQMREGKRARRPGWKQSEYVAVLHLLESHKGGFVQPCVVHFMGDLVSPWPWNLPPEDLLADDWEIVQEKKEDVRLQCHYCDIGIVLKSWLPCDCPHCGLILSKVYDDMTPAEKSYADARKRCICVTKPPLAC
jgi:hypothetical protein